MRHNYMVKVKGEKRKATRVALKAGWETEMVFQVDDEIKPDELRRAIELAGEQVGVGSLRPRFGKFELAGFTIVSE